jgi:hypothetical protein
VREDYADLLTPAALDTIASLAAAFEDDRQHVMRARSKPREPRRLPSAPPPSGRRIANA